MDVELTKDTSPAVTDEQPDRPRILWGAAEIGKEINRTPRQTYHLLAKGLIRCAQQRGNLYSCDRDALLAEFRGA
jgi:hypothetical protein